MTYTRAIGISCNKVILLIVRGLALSKIHPNVLTFLGLVINIGAAALLAVGQFRWAGVVIIGAGLFDMVDGRVARETNRVTRFGGFFDSVLDRYSDLALLVGLLVWYGSINRPFYVVLTAIVMTGSVMVSYTRARAENSVRPHGAGAVGDCFPGEPDRRPSHDLHVAGGQAARGGAAPAGRDENAPLRLFPSAFRLRDVVS